MEEHERKVKENTRNSKGNRAYSKFIGLGYRKGNDKKIKGIGRK